MTGGKIGVIVGSTRPQRICREIAQWVISVAQPQSMLVYELIDLAEIALPFLDEPAMAALGCYEHEHTKRWSALVRSYDGFVFVMPQYNWGYTAVVKNAIDFLYAEWHGKGAATVTYGSHGGGRGAEQLQSVLLAVGMRIVASNPKLETTSETREGARGSLDLLRFAPDVSAMDAALYETITNA